MKWKKTMIGKATINSKENMIYLHNHITLVICLLKFYSLFCFFFLCLFTNSWTNRSFYWICWTASHHFSERFVHESDRIFFLGLYEPSCFKNRIVSQRVKYKW